MEEMALLFYKEEIELDEVRAAAVPGMETLLTSCVVPPKVEVKTEYDSEDEEKEVLRQLVWNQRTLGDFGEERQGTVGDQWVKDEDNTAVSVDDSQKPRCESTIPAGVLNQKKITEIFAERPQEMPEDELPTYGDIARYFYLVSSSEYQYQKQVVLVRDSLKTVWLINNPDVPLASNFAIDIKIKRFLDRVRDCHRSHQGVSLKQYGYLQMVADTLFDIAACQCSLATVSCSEANCESANCVSEHILCTCAPDKRVPVSECAYLRDKRLKLGSAKKNLRSKCKPHKLLSPTLRGARRRRCTKKFAETPQDLPEDELPTFGDIARYFYLVSSSENHHQKQVVLVRDRLKIVWLINNPDIPLASNFTIDMKIKRFLDRVRACHRSRQGVLLKQHRYLQVVADTLFDIAACRCSLATVSCSEANCESAKCVSEHILCTCAPDKRVPVSERAYLRDKRLKFGLKPHQRFDLTQNASRRWRTLKEAKSSSQEAEIVEKRRPRRSGKPRGAPRGAPRGPRGPRAPKSQYYTKVVINPFRQYEDLEPRHVETEKEKMRDENKVVDSVQEKQSGADGKEEEELDEEENGEDSDEKEGEDNEDCEEAEGEEEDSEGVVGEEEDSEEMESGEKSKMEKEAASMLLEDCFYPEHE